jgi:hypothetical protein
MFMSNLPRWLFFPRIEHANNQAKTRGDGSFSRPEEEPGRH